MSPAPSVLTAAPLSVPLLRAAVAALIMAVGLAVGAVAGSQVAGDGEGFTDRLLPVAIIVVSGVVLLRRCWDRRSVSGIGLTGALDGMRSLAFGAGVILLCAAVERPLRARLNRRLLRRDHTLLQTLCPFG